MSKASKRNISRKYRLKRRTLKRRYSTKKQYRVRRTKQLGGLFNPFGNRIVSTLSSVSSFAESKGSAFVDNVTTQVQKKLRTVLRKMTEIKM